MIYLLLIDAEEDKRKFVIIYEKYRHYMFYIANDILKDCYAAEDAVHEAFIKIAKNMQNVGAVDALETERYLHTITKNAAIDIYRKKKRIQENEICMENVEKCKEELQNTVSEYEEEVLETIAHLPTIYRDVIILKYSSCYSIKKIATILNISETNVRQRLFRGKQMIQEAIDKLEAK